jgi:phosphatidylglycerophosphate synthase
MVSVAMPASDELWTSANALTGLRLAAAPALAAAIGADAHLAAALLFALAVATDFADGALARRRGATSRLGGFFDHATDALFVTLGLSALAVRGELTPLLPLLVALAFTQYALDSRVVEGRALRASPLGRWNGLAYYVLLGIPVVRDALGLGWPPRALVAALAIALVASTLASMAMRLAALRRG